MVCHFVWLVLTKANVLISCNKEVGICCCFSQMAQLYTEDIYGSNVSSTCIEDHCFEGKSLVFEEDCGR